MHDTSTSLFTLCSKVNAQKNEYANHYGNAQHWNEQYKVCSVMVGLRLEWTTENEWGIWTKFTHNKFICACTFDCKKYIYLYECCTVSSAACFETASYFFRVAEERSKWTAGNLSASCQFPRCTAPLSLPSIEAAARATAGTTGESDRIPAAAHSSADLHTGLTIDLWMTASAEAAPVPTAVDPTGRRTLHCSHCYSLEKRTHSEQTARAPPETRVPFAEGSGAAARVRHQNLPRGRLSSRSSST